MLVVLEERAERLEGIRHVLLKIRIANSDLRGIIRVNELQPERLKSVEYLLQRAKVFLVRHRKLPDLNDLLLEPRVLRLFKHLVHDHGETLLDEDKVLRQK